MRNARGDLRRNVSGAIATEKNDRNFPRRRQPQRTLKTAQARKPNDDEKKQATTQSLPVCSKPDRNRLPLTNSFRNDATKAGVIGRLLHAGGQRRSQRSGRVGLRERRARSAAGRRDRLPPTPPGRLGHGASRGDPSVPRPRTSRQGRPQTNPSSRPKAHQPGAHRIAIRCSRRLTSRLHATGEQGVAVELHCRSGLMRAPSAAVDVSLPHCETARCWVRRSLHHLQFAAARTERGCISLAELGFLTTRSGVLAQDRPLRLSRPANLLVFVQPTRT